MPRTAKLSTTLAALPLFVISLAACAGAPGAAPSAPADPAPLVTTESVAPTPTPAPTYVTELPEWAKDASPWLIYPDGMECYGTEGCPNDFRLLIGEPGPVLPEGVEYYDPEKHDCRFVQPADVDCSKP